MSKPPERRPIGVPEALDFAASAYAGGRRKSFRASNVMSALRVAHRLQRRLGFSAEELTEARRRDGRFEYQRLGGWFRVVPRRLRRSTV